jgi:hypothetical protein
MPDSDHLHVPQTEGWSYRPLEKQDDGAHRVTLAHEQGAELWFIVPSFVERGEELGEIARVVIRAHDRWHELEGLGA